MTSDETGADVVEAAAVIRPLVRTVEGCAIDGGYQPSTGGGLSLLDLSDRIIGLLADEHLLADPADRDELDALRSDLAAARKQVRQLMIQFNERAAKCALAEMQQERAEAEITELQGRLSELLDNLTGGRMSKTNYDVRTMVQEVEAYFERTADDEVTELRATVERVRAIHEPHVRTYYDGSVTECTACIGRTCPCPTIRALDGGEQS